VKEMDNKKEKYVCDNCGYTADGKFKGDICPKCGLTYWKCGKCGFLISAAIPPNICPSCKEKCDFHNVTCYTPECGGPGNIDPQLL
jgi:rubrerythrin